jgi:hypothetical protein
LKLPRTIPFLHLTFTNERFCPRIVRLVPDQVLHAVVAGEASDDSVFVLPRALQQVVSRPDVERAVPLAGGDVNKECYRRSSWVPACAGTNGITITFEPKIYTTTVRRFAARVMPV